MSTDPHRPIQSFPPPPALQVAQPHPTVLFPQPLNYPYAAEDLNLTQFLQIVRRRKWLMAGMAIAVTSAIWGWTLTRTPIYRGEFRVLVEAVEETDHPQKLLQENPERVSNFDYDTQIEVLRSPALLEPIAEELSQTYPDMTANALAASLVISRLRSTKVLAVSYLDPNPEKIAAVLQAVSESYLSYSFQQRQSSLQQGIEFVDGQLPELRERVNSLQIKLERFRQEYSLVDPESRGNDLSGFISAVEKQRQETLTQLSEIRSLYQTLQKRLGYGPEEAIAASTLSESPTYQNILTQIRAVESQIAAESARFQSDSPNIQVLIDKRDSLLPLLRQEAERLLNGGFRVDIDDNLTAISLELSHQLVNTANQVQVLQARSDALAQVEARLKDEFALVPGLSRQYTDLQRELTIATDSLNRFLATRETLQIEAAQKSIPWELISQPGVSSKPISPKVPRNLILGGLAGLLVGAIAGLLAERLDNSFHSPEELKTLTRLPLLGIIPFIKELQKSPVLLSAGPSPQSLELGVALDNSAPQTATSTSVATTRYGSYYETSPFFEAFRSLYANIRFLGSDSPIRSLVISSATPAEGKSTNALYLAKAAAAMGQRVLVVDADLRCPQLHSRLNLPNLRGLSNLISSNTLTLKQVIQRSPTDENLYVLPAGPIPPDPVKLLSSKKMKTLTAHLQTHFDFIVYDMPPLIGFADSTLLAAHTDGMMLVVGLGKTDRAALMQALESLKISQVPVLGLVANGIKSYTNHAYGYYHYHRYYNRTGTLSTQEKVNLLLQAGQTSESMQLSSVPSNLSSLFPLSPRIRLLLIGGIGVTTLILLVGWSVYQQMDSALPSEPQVKPTVTLSDVL